MRRARARAAAARPRLRPRRRSRRCGRFRRSPWGLPCHDSAVTRTHADGREIVEVADRAAWRAWLAAHHEQHAGIWLAMPRKGSDVAAPTYDEAVEEALCYGWIDSTANTLDERVALLYFAPRKRGSAWARTNKERIERLEREGLIAAAGPSRDRPREGGRFLDRARQRRGARGARRSRRGARVRTRRPPPTSTPSRRARRSRSSGGSRRPSAPETRAKRVAETVRLAEQNVRANQ